MVGPAATENPPGPLPGRKVALDLDTILEHCKCSICMGIVKNTRAVSACMHRFCKDCIEAWLRTQIENNCPQCRVKFSSKRDCKADPNFDLLLGTMFGDIAEFEKQMLDPSVEVLERAKAIGHQIAVAREQASTRRPSPPPAAYPGRQQSSHEQQQCQPRQSSGDAIVHVTVARPIIKVQPAPGPAVELAPVGGPGGGSKRPMVGISSTDLKRQKVSSPGEEEDGGALQYRGVRFQGDNWQARTKRAGKELSLGLYNTAEEAGMAYDLDRLQQQGGKAQRLNFPLLRQHYKQILSDLADLHTPDGLLDFLAVAVQAAVKASRNVPGSTAPENTGPAAASVLNPRRSIAPAVHAPSLPRQGVAATQARAAAGGTAALAEEDFEADELLLAELEPIPPAEQQHSAVQRRAEQLTATYPLDAGLSLGTAHVRLEVGSGVTWQMKYLACPISATVGQLSEAVVLGLSQQHDLEPSKLQVGLAVVNDLDVSADFDSLCYEDSSTGNLLLRGHVTIRQLLGTLQDAAEDLCLEYHGRNESRRCTVAPAPMLPGAVVAAA